MQETVSSFSETLVEKLRGDICSLVFPPDFKLQTQMLENRYQSGLSVVREALCVLAGEGLVVREERKGFRVASMSLADFDQLSDLRVAVELSSLDLAFKSNHPNWRSDINVALQAMGPNVKVGDGRPLGRDWERKHRHFHFSLLNAYRSPITYELCSRIYDRYDRYRYLALPRLAYLASVGQDHREMTESASSNDIEKTKEIITRHIRDTSTTIQTSIVSQNLTNGLGEVVLPPETSS